MAWVITWVHLELFVFFAKVVIVSILIAFQVALVPSIGLVTLTWGKVHVILSTISTTLTLAGCLGIFCILVKAKDR